MEKNSPLAYVLSHKQSPGGVETWIRDFDHFTRGHYIIIPPSAKITASPSFDESYAAPRPRSWFRSNDYAMLAKLALELLKLRTESPVLHTEPSWVL